MDDIRKLAESLHPLERKIFPLLKICNRLSELVKKSELPEAGAMRALQWLQNKGLIIMHEDLKKRIELDKNGKEYALKGLPEQQLLETLQKAGKEVEMHKLQEYTGLSSQEIQIAIGTLKKQSLINLNKQGKDKILLSATTTEPKIFPEHKFLNFIGVEGKENQEIIKHEDRVLMHALSQRKEIIKINLIKDRVVELTQLGHELQYIKLTDNFLDKLTPNMLKTDEWKNKKFRRYDISLNVPKIYPGKRQHYRRFLDNVRQKFLAMGFTEMFGPIVESDFWDMDALFMPQFHSARDIHEAYYIKEPAIQQIDTQLIKNVKSAHEDGFNTSSKGWQYKFDAERTKRTLLRTQGTAASARMLASKDFKVPGKYFAIAKCFRYDVIDATHLPDFYQTEGIVADEGLNFQSLKGLLKMFAEEFAQTEQIKIKPAYFPFTEPSAELFAKHPEMGWIELGGSGIFRPEVIRPLGIDVPVIAWGIGIDRVGMFNMKIDDIRELYTQDLNLLRNKKCQQ
ncbi:phenylalanine--tRNA ligase subunit alpha [Candidatus Woesearchaeota archaeon]|nr:phenylalanine--tRNA ligase subunit alpha [Candidatus Woesearchaeota archaeon]